MKQNILIILITTFTSLSSFASSVEYFCTNETASLVLTEHTLVISLPDKASLELINMLSVSPENGKRIPLLLKSERSQQVGYLHINQVLDRKTLVDQQDPPCANGVEAQLKIETFSLSASLHVSSMEAQTVRMSCAKKSFWSGTCE